MGFKVQDFICNILNMKLNKQRFASRSALVVGGLYILCTVFVALFPSLAMKLTAAMFHMVEGSKSFGSFQVTFGNFLLGLVPLMFYTYVGAWLFAWIFEKSVET